jgi:adenylate kinase
MFNLILFGPPGSGKGTQSDKLIKKYGWIHLSTGDLLRAERNNKTVLGLEAQKYMDQGKLVPDEVVIGMIGSALDANPQAKGFLFDGFPRTVAQAKALDDLLAQKGTEISLVLALEVGLEELVKRLLNRGLTSGRSDDTEEATIRARQVEYQNKTAQVADYYDQFGKVTTIRGEGSIDEIFEAISSQIEKKKTGSLISS